MVETVQTDIKSLIYVIRNRQVMVDSDLAMLYQVETKRLNEAVKRNIARFPEEFRFQLTEEEAKSLRSQFATLNENDGRGKHRKYLPYVFTEQGIAMLSAVLRSDVAVQVSISMRKNNPLNTEFSPHWFPKCFLSNFFWVTSISRYFGMHILTKALKNSMSLSISGCH